MASENGLGDIREAQLFEVLQKRFGEDCVYRSPKVDKKGGEKELCDVMILALPYAVVFQLKWMKQTAADLTGEKAEVKRERLIRRMQEAAHQFTEFNSSLTQSKPTQLPRVWAKGNGTYALSLDWIKYIVPVVLIDFEDDNYDNPKLRYTDIPPVITDVPSQIKNWGKVHGFLMRDFKRIVEQLFTVGDLLIWLNEREKLLAMESRSFVGYNELTLFAIYLVKNPIWKKMMASDGVWIDDDDLFERVLKDQEAAFAKRKDLFGGYDFVNKLESMLADSMENMCRSMADQNLVRDYLSYAGRVKCLAALEKWNMAYKFIEHLETYAPCGSAASTKVSYAFCSHYPLSRTVICFGVADFDEGNANAVCQHAFLRTLSYVALRGKQSEADEIMIILVRHDRPSVGCVLYTIDPSDYAKVLTGSELEKSRSTFSENEYKLSEWDVVRQAISNH